MRLFFGFLLLSAATSLNAKADSACGFPARQAKAAIWSSAEFYQQNVNPSVTRELQVVAQVLQGNVPDSLRNFVPLQIPATIHGENVVIGISVAPDYLMIGTDTDFVRTPLTNYAAQYLAAHLGFVLPTTYLVDLIYDKANTQLVPQPTDWYLNAPTMREGPNYVIFNHTIEEQRNGRGGLVAGHKKDVVLTNLLDTAIDHVAIYGWQEPGNKPIQPLVVVHDYTYEDYSHGIRFIGPFLTVTDSATGKATTWPTAAALKDADLGTVLNGGQPPLDDVRAARVCATDFASATGLSEESCPPQPRSCTATAVAAKKK